MNLRRVLGGGIALSLILATLPGEAAWGAPAAKRKNHPPAAHIAAPLDGGRFEPGAKVALSGDGTDAEDGESELKFHWTVESIVGPKRRARVLSAQGKTAVWATPKRGAAPAYEIRLVVMDGDRGRDTAIVQVAPAPAPAALAKPTPAATAEPPASATEAKSNGAAPAPKAMAAVKPDPKASEPKASAPKTTESKVAQAKVKKSKPEPAPKKTAARTGDRSQDTPVAVPGLAAVAVNPTAPPPPSVGTMKPADSTAEVDSSAIQLGPGDVLHIAVYAGGEKQEDFTAEVSRGGTLTAPLIGEIEVAGTTASDLSNRIRSLLARDFFVDPQVLVSVREHPRKVFVSGEVKNPGVYNVEEGLTVLSACTIAGGFTDYAAVNRVRILRNLDGKSQAIELDLVKVRRGKAPDLAVVAGDRIDVPHRRY